MKKNTTIIIPLLILSVFILTACQFLPWFGARRGSGNMTTEARPVSDFDAIRLDGAGRMIITQGTAPSLEIQAEDNLINLLTSEVQEATLVLGYQDRLWRRTIIPTRPIQYNLTVTDLAQLTLNGAGDLEIQSLQTDALVIQINGAGNIVIEDLSAQNLTVNLAGTGSIKAAGVATNQVINLDGAGNYQGGDLRTQSTSIKISGLGNGTVWAAETLQVTIAGGGSVSYYGSPQVTQEITGLGEIRNLGEK